MSQAGGCFSPGRSSRGASELLRNAVAALHSRSDSTRRYSATRVGGLSSLPIPGSFLPGNALPSPPELQEESMKCSALALLGLLALPLAAAAQHDHPLLTTDEPSDILPIARFSLTP